MATLIFIVPLSVSSGTGHSPKGRDRFQLPVTATVCFSAHLYLSARKPGMKEIITEMAFNGAGVRGSRQERTLKIGINTIIRTLKNSRQRRNNFFACCHADVVSASLMSNGATLAVKLATLGSGTRTTRPCTGLHFWSPEQSNVQELLALLALQHRHAHQRLGQLWPGGAEE